MNLSQTHSECVFVSRHKAVNLFAPPVSVTRTGNSRLAAFCFGTEMKTKRCSKCGQVKTLNEFYRDLFRPDGRRAECKACHNAKKKQYRFENQDCINERNSKWYKNNKEYIKKYRKEHPEIEKRWQENNPASVKAKFANYKARKKNNGGHFSAKEWRCLVKRTGNKCLSCGIPGNHRTLEPDHVISLYSGGRNDIENIQPLCRSCNAIKGRNNTDYR